MRSLCLVAALCGASLLVPSAVLAQRAAPVPAPAPANVLRDLSASVESLTRRVSLTSGRATARPGW
jgi:hypothetical protein